MRLCWKRSTSVVCAAAVKMGDATGDALPRNGPAGASAVAAYDKGQIDRGEDREAVAGVRGQGRSLAGT